MFRASIWDVIVDRDYQGQKIGTEIVRRILDHPTLQQVELFWLCTRRPGFYERLWLQCQGTDRHGVVAQASWFSSLIRSRQVITFRSHSTCITRGASESGLPSDGYS